MPLTTRRAAVTAPTTRADLVVKELTGFARSAVRGLFDHGCVEVNGAVDDRAGRPLAVGDVVQVRYEPTRRYKEKPPAWRSRAFRILHEDAHLIVIEKAAGVLTVPTEKRETTTLVDEIGRYLSRGSHRQRVAIVHRLDRDTSGVLVFAKSADVAARLKDQFEARKPEREYVAFVAGHLANDAGTFRSYLRTTDDLDQESVADPAEGKLAITHFAVVERVFGATNLRVRLETGRRNQIRVHLAEAGHPVLGDVRYEPVRATHPLWREKRLALHALTLGLVHPVTGATLRFTSPVPPELERFLVAARRRS